MSFLHWREADLKLPDDKRALQRFRCTSELEREVSAGGLDVVHPEVWAYEAQALIQERVRTFKKKRWTVRLGMTEDDSLGAVMVCEELAAGDVYNLTVGALAQSLRGRHRGLGDEMISDMKDQIGARCVELGTSHDVLLTGLIHCGNHPSKRMCERNGLTFTGETVADYEDWSGYFTPPQPVLFA